MKTGPEAIDSVLLIGFGGPEKPEDIMPFLRNVVRGRKIPDERLREVERHYLHLGGRSPYNEWTERQRRGVRSWLAGHSSSLPVYVGMRNWHPFLAESLKAMSVAGLQNALGIILAPHQSEASWGRYIQDFLDAVEENGGVAPALRFLDPFFARPRFLEACAQRLEEATGYRRGA